MPAAAVTDHDVLWLLHGMQTFLGQLERTGGAAAVPPGVQRVLASRACHTAIRCGTAVQPCYSTPSILAACSSELPFCKAHSVQ
jgi:hypothetical protein